MTSLLKNRIYVNVLKYYTVNKNYGVYCNCMRMNENCSQNFEVKCRPNLEIFRYKSKRSNKKLQEESSSETQEEENEEPEASDKNNKVLNIKVNSLRADVVLKAGLGMARNKVEKLFYESRIRVNGKKLFKKSELVNIGDEVDIIKGTDVNNPDFLTVARVELLSVAPKNENLSLQVRRCKSLCIENYEDPWKGA